MELPFSSMARAELRKARKQRDVAAAVGALGGAALFALTAQSSSSASLVWIARLLVVAVAFVLLGQWRMREASVGVELDASRRWVTCQGVHANFATALDEAAATRR